MLAETWAQCASANLEIFLVTRTTIYRYISFSPFIYTTQGNLGRSLSTPWRTAPKQS